MHSSDHYSRKHQTQNVADVSAGRPSPCNVAFLLHIKVLIDDGKQSRPGGELAKTEDKQAQTRQYLLSHDIVPDLVAQQQWTDGNVDESKAGDVHGEEVGSDQILFGLELVS